METASNSEPPRAPAALPPADREESILDIAPDRDIRSHEDDDDDARARAGPIVATTAAAVLTNHRRPPSHPNARSISNTKSHPPRHAYTLMS